MCIVGVDSENVGANGQVGGGIGTAMDPGGVYHASPHCAISAPIVLGPEAECTLIYGIDG